MKKSYAVAPMNEDFAEGWGSRPPSVAAVARVARIPYGRLWRFFTAGGSLTDEEVDRMVRAQVQLMKAAEPLQEATR